MVAADDQRAKRLWNLFQSHVDGGEHVVVIDRHLGLMFQAQHPVAKVGEDSAIVFGWVLASHQVGAALVAFLGGVARDAFGSYDVVWYASGALCAAAALMALVIRRRPATGTPAVPAIA